MDQPNKNDHASGSEHTVMARARGAVFATSATGFRLRASPVHSAWLWLLHDLARLDVSLPVLDVHGEVEDRPHRRFLENPA